MNIAIVTGASSGVGREFALQPSDYVQVNQIWAIARRPEALEAGVPIRPVPLSRGGTAGFDAFARLLPHSPVMKIWLNQQKKFKNNQGLTAK